MSDYTLEYDVFVSYKKEDGYQAEKIANGLKNRGLKVWFDKWCCHLGNTDMESITFMESIENGIMQTRCTIVVLGKNSVTGWQKEEQYFALQMAVEHNRKLFPVILHEAPEILEGSALLKLRTYFDFREYLPSEGLDRLTSIIKGKPIETSHEKLAEIDEKDKDIYIRNPRIREHDQKKIFILPSVWPDVEKIEEKQFAKDWKKLHTEIEKLYSYGFRDLYLNMDRFNCTKKPEYRLEAMSKMESLEKRHIKDFHDNLDCLSQDVKKTTVVECLMVITNCTEAIIRGLECGAEDSDFKMSLCVTDRIVENLLWALNIADQALEVCISSCLASD